MGLRPLNSGTTTASGVNSYYSQFDVIAGLVGATSSASRLAVSKLLALRSAR